MSKQRAVKGVLWSGIERFSLQIVQFAISVVLARILTPSDFGVLALVMVMLNVLQIFNEVGFLSALIYKTDRDELDFSTVFVFNIIMGLVLYIILFLLSPAIAYFFHNRELIRLIQLMGINLIISSFVVVHRTKLLINVDFKTQAKASFIAVVLSGAVGIYCAYKGYGVLSLVIQSLLNNFLNTVFIWLYVKWKPSVKFSLQRFKTLFDYAYKLILARLVHSVFNEIYSIVIGKFYSPAQLGFYNRAKSFTEMSSGNITSVVQRVSVPILCEAQHDHDKMKSVLMQFIRNTAFITFPMLCGLFVLAEPLISVILTDKWLPAAWMLRVLCPVGMMFVISTFNINVFNATGRTDWAFQSEVIKKGIYLIILAIAVFVSFEALVYSQILIAVIELLVATYYTKKQIGLGIIFQLKSLFSIFLISVIMSVVVHSVTLLISDNLLKLFIGILTGAIIYLSLIYTFDISNSRMYINRLLMKIKSKK